MAALHTAALVEYSQSLIIYHLSNTAMCITWSMTATLQQCYTMPFLNMASAQWSAIIVERHYADGKLMQFRFDQWVKRHTANVFEKSISISIQKLIDLIGALLVFEMSPERSLNPDHYVRDAKFIWGAGASAISFYNKRKIFPRRELNPGLLGESQVS